MTVYYDNSAGRLYRVLDNLSRSPGGQSVRDAWSQVLETNDKTVLSRRLMEVFQLPPKIDLELQQLDPESFDHDLAMRWWEPVEGTFSDTLFSTAQMTQIRRYDSASLASLEHSSYLLHQFRREAMPTDDDLETVRLLVSELEELVAVDGDIDADLREFLSKHARAMRIALEDFKLTGAQAMEDVVDQAIGAAIRKGYFPENADEEVAEDETGRRPALKKFWAMLTRVALILSMTANLLALGQAAHTDLTTHSQQPPAVEHVTGSPDSMRSGQTAIELPAAEPGPAMGPGDANGH